MIRVGLTGGIGSGKSIVASLFEHLSVPVYHADAEAKRMLDDPEIIREITRLFGDSVLDAAGLVNRKLLAAIVFTDPAKLDQLNGLIHPAVKSDFLLWCEQHREYAYVLQEAAILFETGFNKLFDKTIAVYAPRDIAVQRVIKRDHVSAEEVMNRMKNQWLPEQVAGLADYVIQNDGTRMLLPQVLEIDRKLRKG